MLCYKCPLLGWGFQSITLKKRGFTGKVIPLWCTKSTSQKYHLVRIPPPSWDASRACAMVASLYWKNTFLVGTGCPKNISTTWKIMTHLFLCIYIYVDKYQKLGTFKPLSDLPILAGVLFFCFHIKTSFNAEGEELQWSEGLWFHHLRGRSTLRESVALGDLEWLVRLQSGRPEKGVISEFRVWPWGWLYCWGWTSIQLYGDSFTKKLLGECTVWWAQNKGQTFKRLFSDKGMKTVPSYIRIDFINHEFMNWWTIIMECHWWVLKTAHLCVA